MTFNGMQYALLEGSIALSTGKERLDTLPTLFINRREETFHVGEMPEKRTNPHTRTRRYLLRRGHQDTFFNQR